MKFPVILYLALFAGILSAISLAETPRNDPAPEKTRSAAERKCRRPRAGRPKQLGLDLKKYLIVPVDKNEPTSVLSDSDIKPFLAPGALEADWWIVLFLPEKAGSTPPMCVYLDKTQDAVRGYLIGPPPKSKDQAAALIPAPDAVTHR